MAIEQIPECPNEIELEAFATGKLSDARLNSMAVHVEDCDSCGKVIDEISGPHDSDLVSALRTLKEQADSSFEPSDHVEVPAALVRAACDASNTSSIPVSFDAGRRLANRLKNDSCRLGRFDLVSELGVGSFGYVFKALDTTLDRLVALKVQRAGTFATDRDVQRFLREAQSIAQLNHPGIVAVHDTVCSDEDICYLVTEYIEGESLDKYMQSTSLSFGKCANLIASIADALHYAHDNGIVHRDVKPSNVLIDHFGNPHVTDFGLAKRDMDDEDAMTSIGRIMGTPAYMSPEQATGDSRRIDARSDIYSLGVMLYEMLTGERPFQGNRRMLLLQVIEDEPRPLRQLNPRIPVDLETICLKAISKAQSRRYQSAAEMADDLRRFMQGQPIKARQLGFKEKLWRWCRSFPLAASLLFAVPLVSIGGFTYLSWLSTKFVHSTALESARLEANMLEDINEYYSESVLGHLDQNVVSVTHEYKTTPNSLPLPFTFMIDASEEITDDESGMQVKIFSENPWRSKCGPQDEFEARAIKALQCRNYRGSGSTSKDACAMANGSASDRSYHEFGTVDGEPVLRYARAQIMRQSCIDCHNHEPKSPKQDWVVGDVAGVLSITRPLQHDIESTQSALRSAFHLIGGMATLLTGLSMVVFWFAKRRTLTWSGETG